MGQLRKLIAALSLKQRVTIVFAAAASVLAIVGLTHWRKESDFKPLYTSLSPDDAAAVVQKLKESATEYRVSENGSTVLAPSAHIAELRLDLAAAGLPKTGRIGYELFDKTNFGATEFTEHLNYHRALEGELERSISALSAVEQARVHITFPKDSVFLDSREPAKASVLLKIRVASRLTEQNVAAIANLVASAVEGLGPEAVSILDMRGNLLNRPHHDLGGDQPSEATLEYRQKIENDLLAKINSTLEPLLGPDKFRAGVSVDCDFTSGEQSEETLDPTRSVMVSAQKSEEQGGASLAAGQPGTASNLPRPTSRPGGGASGVSRRTENIAYQSSRLVKRIKLPQGAIKRMSISVLVDHAVRMEGSGPRAKRILVPPSAETLKGIHDLVAAVTGLSVDRGDQLVVESLPFESTKNFEPMELSAPAKPADPRVPRWLAPFVQSGSGMMMLVGGALCLLLMLGFGAFILFRKRGGPAQAAAPGTLGGASRTSGALSAEDINAQIAAQRAEQVALQEQVEAEILKTLKIPVATTKKAEVLIKHIRENVSKDNAASANVLRTWLNESEARSL